MLGGGETDSVSWDESGHHTFAGLHNQGKTGIDRVGGFLTLLCWSHDVGMRGAVVPERVCGRKSEW